MGYGMWGVGVHVKINFTFRPNFKLLMMKLNGKTSITRSLTVNLTVISLYILIRGGRTLRSSLPIIAGDCLYYIIVQYCSVRFITTSS